MAECIRAAVVTAIDDPCFLVSTLLDNPLRAFNLESVLSRVSQAKVTVFGDFCLDAYWLMDPGEDEKSVETGLPVRRVRRQRYNLGGAGNVVANLIDLGIQRVRAVGVVGADPFGVELLRLLNERGTDTSGMVVLGPEWQTTMYAKPYSAKVEGNRLDFGSFNELPEDCIDLLTAELDRAAAASSVVILNQQVAGGISVPGTITRINRVIAEHPGTQFIVDARHRAALYRGAIFKLNSKEASLLAGEHADGDPIQASQARGNARRLFEKTRQPVFLTRGENGMLVADERGLHEIPGIQILERTDPVGAGDTAVAALAVVLGSGGEPLEAGMLANVAASVTVRKLQTTGTATPAEIRALGSDPDYVYQPELAADVRRARFVNETEIEVVGGIPDNLRIRHALFDHDGTISTLREGWEQIMKPMMVRAILGPRYADADLAVYRNVVDTIRTFIDKTTGVQTLVQMQGLVRLVRQFGFVSPNDLLDEYGYKRIYNEQLLEVVRGRIKKLENRELEPSDFEVKNAIRFLECLYSCGVKLYLVSGTDHADVAREAEAMGYARLFEGRIFGAVGDVNVDAKQIVVERIMREHNLSGCELVTFGDGPVEIRQTHKRGGICIGVASNEIRRFGLNPAKRSRLIRAGANFIIPDFSQLSSLLRLLRLDATEGRCPMGNAKWSG